jgi:glycosyltransferase involved in cell wall biosynthesis
MELGVLPALGGGIADLARTGQASRLIDGYLRPYAAAFDRVWYLSYLDAAVERSAAPRLPDRVRLLAPRGRRPRLLRAIEIAVAHRRELRRCAALRVFQVTGAIPALLARARWGVPFVTTYGFWYAELSSAAWSRIAKRALERVALRRAAGVIVPTPELGAHVRSIAPDQPIHLIPNGVDLRRFRPDGRRSGHGACVLYVGRLSPEKNLSALVAASAMLRSRLPVRLVMIGAGPLRDRLEIEARDAGVSAEFPGVVDHDRLPAYLDRADAFVLPSFTEGHPKALIEAMAAGVPCIASDCAGNRALVKHDETGLLFEPRDPAALAACLERVLTDPAAAAAIGRRGHEAIARDHDLDRLVQVEIALLTAVGLGAASH